MNGGYPLHTGPGFSFYRIARHAFTALLLLSALALAACGGGGDGSGGGGGGPPPPGVTVLAFGTADLPAAGQTVSIDGNTQYQITGLTAGNDYNVSITGTNNIDVSVYDDSGFSSLLCAGVTLAIAENCDAIPSGTSLFVTVDDSSGLGDIFTLDVEVVVNVFNITNFLILAGQTVSPGGIVRYEITNPDGFLVVNVSIDGTNDIDLFVFSDSGFSSLLCDSATLLNSESCDSSPLTTFFFVEVRDSSGLGDTFTLRVFFTRIPPL